MIRFYNGPVLTLQQDQMNITHQEVWVDGNRIVCLGANPGAKADREIDLNGDLLMPAFKNAHTHSAMTFGRSFSDDLPLQSWLYDKIFPLEAKLTAEDIYHLSRLAFLEYLESGISACFDMYYFPEAMAKAAVDAGFRTVMCGAVNNFKESPALLEEYYNTYNNDHPLVSYQLGFHAEYTTNRSIMEAIAALAEKYKAPVYMHASETESEVQDCIGRYGMAPTALFEQLGLWNYGGGAFHSVWVSNAVEHTDRARGIVVRLQMEVYEGQEYLTATVRDFGKGFSEQDLIYADQEFYSGDASRHDRTHQGLGLAIAKKFLKEQGGMLCFSNHKETGAEVVCRIKTDKT